MLTRHLSFIAFATVYGGAPFAVTAAAPGLGRAVNATSAAAPTEQTAPTRASLLRNLDATFKAIDTNGNGTLDSAEIAAAEVKAQQQRLAQIRARFEAEFAKLDTDRNGQLSKVEFMAAAPNAAATPPNGTQVLLQLDKDKDGTVSLDEYRSLPLAKFNRIDTNHDGVLSAAERQAAMAAQPQSR